MSLTMLADVTVSSGDSLVHSLFAVLIIAICVGLIWALGRWVITKFAAPAIAMTVWNFFFLLVGAIVIINFLMSLGGHQFIKW